MSTNGNDMQEWLKRWRGIKSRGNASDYDLACFYRDLVKAIGLAKANVFVGDTLGEGASGIERYGEMCGALETVRDKTVWAAVGWRGVEKVTGVLDETKRAEVCRRIADAAKVGGGVVNYADLQALVKPYLFREEPPSPPSPKGGTGAMGPVRKADILTVEIRNLIDAGLVKPTDLSPLARSVVEEAFGPLEEPATTKRKLVASR